MPAAGESALGRAWAHGERLQRLGRSSALAALGLGIFALVLLAFGKNPVKAYADIFTSTLGSWYGLSETLVKMIPLVLAAVAVAVPAQIWLINVGGEGVPRQNPIRPASGRRTTCRWPGDTAGRRVEHFMLSSDAGIPILPQTVEAYRLLTATARAYGMTEPEMRQLMSGSAEQIVRNCNEITDSFHRSTGRIV